MKPRGPLSAEARARISTATRAAMADPAVRARISERTREGMAKASPLRPELVRLQDAWSLARPEVRVRFLNEIISPVCAASDDGGGSGDR
jgi:hypothetical protein